MKTKDQKKITVMSNPININKQTKAKIMAIQNATQNNMKISGSIL